jgi:hypothetical protein
MQDEIKVSEGYQPTHQFISFTEGSASEAPDPSAYATHILAADHNLNHISGGDATDGFSTWVTDLLVYPSSEYWESLLDSNKIRPYVDLSISNYNTLRIPSAVHDYNLYVDDATIYGDLTILGNTNFGGVFQLTGDVTVNSITSQGDISGVDNTKAKVESVTSDYTFTPDKTGVILNCSPSGGNINITLPTGPEDGLRFTVMILTSGNTITFPTLTNAKGNQITSQYSTATIYSDNNSWYGFGDLV